MPPAERFFERHGGKAVFLARFFGGVRVTGAWMAGITRMTWWRSSLWNALGGIVWAVGCRPRRLLRRQGGGRRARALRRLRRHRRRLSRRARHRSACTSCGAARRARRESRRRVLPPGARVRCSRPAAAAAAVPAFDHVVVFVFENKERGSVLGNRCRADVQPHGDAVREPHPLLRRHASEPAELPRARVRLDAGITIDCTSCIVDAEQLADTLEASGSTWKTYAEGLPRPGSLGAYDGPLREEAQPVPLLPRASPTSRPRRAQSCRSPSSRRTFERERCPTSRSSSRTCATRCTTARVSDRRHVAAPASLPPLLSCRTRSSSSSSTRAAPTFAAAATSPALALGRPSAGLALTALTGHYGAPAHDRGRVGPAAARALGRRRAPITGIWR